MDGFCVNIVPLDLDYSPDSLWKKFSMVETGNYDGHFTGLGRVIFTVSRRPPLARGSTPQNRSQIL
jgi:hypothetical protein